MRLNRTALSLATLAIVFVAFASPGVSAAQTPKPAPKVIWTEMLGCSPGERVGDLGVNGIECVNCTISGRHVEGKPDIEFATEPVLTGIRKGGPADGKLEERDVLVAIDGQLITTLAASTHYSWLTPGKAVKLTVRRQGALKDVEIVPAPTCRPLTPDVVHAQPFVFSNKIDKPGVFQDFNKVGYATALTGRGWFGLGLSCGDCGLSLGLHVESAFRSYPEVAKVTADSPAAKAGFKVGDLLVAIDGVSLKSMQGSTKFREVKPNQRVTLLVVRDGEVVTITLTAAAAASAR